MNSRWLFWSILSILLVHIQADTKILHEFNISSDDSNRRETFSLKNKNTPAEELVIKGTHSQVIFPKNNKDFVYIIESIYVADKDGYRVKYKLVSEPFEPAVLHLSPITLKSVAG